MVISIPHYTNLTSLSLENILYLLQHWYAQQLTTNWYSNIFEYIYIWLAWSNNKEVNCGVESPLRSNYQFRARLLLLDIGSDKTIPTTSCEFINIWDTDNILFTTYEYFNNIYIFRQRLKPPHTLLLNCPSWPWLFVYLWPQERPHQQQGRVEDDVRAYANDIKIRSNPPTRSVSNTPTTDRTMNYVACGQTLNGV